MINHFTLHQGYVEEQSLVCMMLRHETGFETAEEGMEHFYQVLLSLAAEKVPKAKKCCAATFDKHETARFCMICGFDKSREETPEEFVTQIWQGIWGGTWDSIGMATYRAFEDAGWSWSDPLDDDETVTCFRVERFFERWDGEPDSDLLTSE